MNDTVKQSGNMELPWWVMVMDLIEPNPHPAFYSGHATEEEATQLASSMQEQAEQKKKEMEEWNVREKDAKEPLGLTPKLETIHQQQYSVVERTKIVTACLDAMPREQLLQIYRMHNKAPERKPTILSKLPMGTPVTIEVLERIEAEEEAWKKEISDYEKSIEAMDDATVKKALLGMSPDKMHPGYLIQKPSVV